MARHKLKAAPWAERAGISPNTIYNFLNGRSDSLSVAVYEKLADSAGVPIAESRGERTEIDDLAFSTSR